MSPARGGADRIEQRLPGDHRRQYRQAQRDFRRDERWSGYPLPFLREWKSFSFLDPNVSKAAFRSGQLDYMNLSDYVGLNDMLATNPEAVIEVIAPNPTNAPYRWELNNQDDILRDVRVRRALNMALNRREMIDSLFREWVARKTF